MTPAIKTTFINTKNGFTYFGVKITAKVKTIIPSNYEPLIDRVTETISVIALTNYN